MRTAQAHARIFKQYGEALKDYDKALAGDPGLDYLIANGSDKLYGCRWDDYEKDCSWIVDGVRKNTLKVDPFMPVARFRRPPGISSNAPTQFVRR